MSSKQKKWQILPNIKEEIINEYPEYLPLVLQLLHNRGITEKEEIKNFLEGDYEKNSHDPFLFQDMKKAVELTINHIKKRNKITVYGDYDADGVTSSAILVELFKLFKAEVDVYIPHRVKEGYGVNRQAVDLIAKNNTKLIITVDTGIRSKKEIADARELGIDVIVTDHHVPPKELNEYPECLIINSAITADKYPDNFLAGVGVAFKFAKALIDSSKLSKKDKQDLSYRFLDLVAIGTVADCVKLTGENRILVKKGLEVLSNTKRIGLSSLYEIAKINNNNKIDTWNIGFQIGPRLNAAGRLDHANTAYQLLITKDSDEAKKLAQELNNSNQERQQITEEIFLEVEEQINVKDDNILIGVYNLENNKSEKETAWNEGVVGLVAGKIVNKYFRPSLVITKTKNGYKGSGRSIPCFNLIKAIEQCADFLDKYGGHPQACGFSFSEENLDNFVNKIKDIAKKEIIQDMMRPIIKIDAILNFEEINEDLYEKISALAPYGQGNERPVFLSESIKIFDITTMGMEGQHIKFKLKNDKSGFINAISFGGSEIWKDFAIGDIINIVYNLDLNVFNGRSEVQLKMVDIKKEKREYS
ncbi:single-stranded-DNA-specific exonuclease RecJ [Candidatus Parcubacteria bacterium]|nr:single-stranded-DNA-specific exonuclease RecJ [Candidatus Parcubacteria bacterium]